MSPKISPGELSADEVTSIVRLTGEKELDDFLRTHPNLLQPEAVEHLADLVRRLVRVDVPEALRTADAALRLAGRMGEPGSLGRATRAKANALWFQGECKQAVELFQAAVAHFEQAGQQDEIARTYSSSIQPLALMGEYEVALQTAAKAREILRRLDDRYRLARLEINVANIHHRQDRFSEAFACYEQAYRELIPYKDSEGLGVALHNMAVCLIMLNDFDRALACYRSARDLCQQHDMPLLAAQADYNIAYLHFLRGSYDLALDGLRTTRDLCQRNGDSYHLALCELDQAEIYSELNLAVEAARMATEAELRFEKLAIPFEQGRAVVIRAIAMHQQENLETALELFATAKGILARENNRAWLALIDLYQALLLREKGDVEGARKLCAGSLQFFEETGLERRGMLCRLLLARLALDAGHEDEARDTCLAVLERVATLDAPLFNYQTHLLLGHARSAAGCWNDAYASYDTARSELERLCSGLRGEELKIAFIANKLEVYESLVRLCLRKGTPADDVQAFLFMEQAKSRRLLELLGHGVQPTWRELDGEQPERIRALRRELNWYYHRIEAEQTSSGLISRERIHLLCEQANRREQELLQTVRERRWSQESAEGLYAADPRDLAEIREALGTETDLVEYFQIGGKFLAAVLTENDLSIVPLADAAGVLNSIRMLKFQLSNFRLRAVRSRAFEAHMLAATRSRLQKLYEDLMAPIAPLLQRRRLVVVPHGALHYLPFHALLDGEQYLIDRHIISLAPSASVFAVCQRKAAGAGSGSLLLGVKDESTPWIEQEIQSIAEVVPEPRVFIGDQATDEALRTIGPGSRLIHIATHGFFRKDNPMFSSVRLADSYLSLYDLYQLRLPAELLTLSGCGTGLSTVVGGDEILGLTRGLLYAGASTVLLSLWDVEDRCTAEFMTSFYTCWARMQDKSQALQAAMQQLRAENPHPYCWAAFALTGKAF